MDRWQTEETPEGPRRLDVVVADRYSTARNQAQRWIRRGRVTVDGKEAKGSTPISGGEWIECEPIEPADRETLAPESGELTILHQDSDLIVLDKPAGIIVHPGAGRAGGTLANRLLAHDPGIAGVGGPGRPGIVHRLDRDTTGVMVVARTPRAYAELSSAFAERRIEKIYLAGVYGTPSPAAGAIEYPIGRHRTRRQEMTVTPDGRPARTLYRTLGDAGGVSALRVVLESGRTHQIRVHLKAKGHPLVGDPVYGEARWKGVEPSVRGALRGFSRPALHAWSLAFEHPGTGARVSFAAPAPDDLESLWAAVGGSRPLEEILATANRAD